MLQMGERRVTGKYNLHSEVDTPPLSNRAEPRGPCQPPYSPVLLGGRYGHLSFGKPLSSVLQSSANAIRYPSCTPRYTSKRNEGSCPPKKMCTMIVNHDS